MFLRRLGPDPHNKGLRTYACLGCPDIWELETGDFAVIGTDITGDAHSLPPTASCGPDERIVRMMISSISLRHVWVISATMFPQSLGRWRQKRRGIEVVAGEAGK